MACNSDTIAANACLSEIGRVGSEIELLQIIAQNMANWVVALSPSTLVTPDAIDSRACTSGIGWEQSEVNLLRIITQNLCGMIT